MNFSDQYLESLNAAREAGMSTLNHVAVLVMCGRSESGQILANLCRVLLVSSAAMTGIADALEKARLVERKKCPGDRRAFRLTLTDKGREALDLILNPKPTKHV